MSVPRFLASFIGVVSLFWGGLTVQTDGLAFGETEAGTARGLVVKLGDASFVVRKRAMADLAKMGLPALPALVEGSRSSNREIRYRSKHVLGVVRDLDFQRRLVAFLKDDEPGKYQLPGWERFSELVGISPESKSLFVEMQRAEQALMAEAKPEGEKLAGALTQRLTAYAKNRSPSEKVSSGFTAAVLFVASDGRVLMTPTLTNLLYRVVLDSRVKANIRDDSNGQDEVMRLLVGAFLVRYGSSDPHRALNLALDLGMRQAVVFAARILQGEPKTGRSREAALLTINFYRETRHLELVEKFLDDTYTMPRSRRERDGRLVQPKIQIRDIALATAITLAGEDHVKFGFPHLRKDEFRLFDVTSLEFASEEDRQTAIAAWRKHRASGAGTAPAEKDRP